MSEAKHTPGPWFFHKGYSWTIIADGQPIMSNERYYPWVPDEEADWRLIAAAPELLDALSLYLAHAPEPECAIWRHVHQKAHAAIAKATGQQT